MHGSLRTGSSAAKKKKRRSRMKRNMKKTVILLLCIAMIIALLPVTAAEEGGLSGEYVDPNPDNLEQTWVRIGWEVSADGKELTLTHIYNDPSIQNDTRDVWLIARDIGDRLGKTWEDVANGIESLKLIGFDVAGSDLYVLKNLRSIDFGTVSVIEDWAFNNLPIEEVTIPGTVKTVSAFESCHALRSVRIEDGVEQIAFGAFRDCENLTEVTIPKSVKRIGLNAFSGTPWLENQTDEFVVVGDGVLIRYNGTGKTELAIPAGIRSVCCTLGFTHEFRRFGNDTNDSANMTNPDLETVVFGPDVEEIYGACYGLRKLENVVLPEGLVSVGAYSFFQCDSLTEITLPESLRYLFWKETFGAYRTDPEGFAGDLDENHLYPYGLTPTVIFLGAPPTVHPDENPSYECPVMWNGDAQSLGELQFDLSPGVIWHLRYSLKHAEEWDAFDPDSDWVSYMVWNPAYIPFAEQYDLQPFYRKGDANLDGSVTSADAALILRHVIGMELLSDMAKTLADVNGDGRITAADAAIILRYIIGLIHTL